MSSRKVSAKYALTEQELDFCLRYKAGLPAATAYHRAFFKDLADDDPKLPNSKARSARAQTLLAQDYIQAYLAEIDGGTAGDAARSLLVDAAKFEGDRVAAQKILEQEDKLNVQDAYERWVEIMCAIGTEVVVPLPDGSEAVVPMREMFPRYAEALPPPAVIEKTMKTLDQYLWKVEHPHPDAFDPREWEFLDGMNRQYQKAK